MGAGGKKNPGSMGIARLYNTKTDGGGEEVKKKHKPHVTRDSRPRLDRQWKWKRVTKTSPEKRTKGGNFPLLKTNKK